MTGAGNIPHGKSKPASLQALPGLNRLTSDLESLQCAETSIHLICFDILSLRFINSAYGRDIGDALLQAISDWAHSLPEGKLYRVEGDLFCLLFLDEEFSSIIKYTEAIDQRFSRPWVLSSREKTSTVFVQTTIAIIPYEKSFHSQNICDLLNRALDYSQNSRRTCILDFETDEKLREHMKMQFELKTCIFSGMAGFYVQFQPIADPVKKTWKGLETLCRFTSPNFGKIPPDVFIPECEALGVIHIVGLWVLKTAIRICKEQQLDQFPDFFISVNISATQVVQPTFAEDIQNVLCTYEYPPDKLLLEITESTAFTFNSITTTAIEKLRSLGVMFALDDFGTGYSGFNNLKKLPVDFLKTEREFIEDIENDHYLQYFYYIMSETAHASGMRLIAEGVESGEQLRSVTKSGADLIQGFFFGKPMDANMLSMQKSNFKEPIDSASTNGLPMIDLRQWINGQDAYKITPALFRLLSQCLNIITSEEDINVAIQKVLGTIGTHFKVNRVYVFLQETGTVFSNKYEWCAEGVPSQLELFQYADATEDKFYDILRENEIVIAHNYNQLPSNLRRMLEEGGQKDSIQSIVVLPMNHKGEIRGFVGFDDSIERDWVPEEIIILHNLCIIALLVLTRS